MGSTRINKEQVSGNKLKKLSRKAKKREREANEIIRRLKAPPTPPSRRLNATWTIEALKDLTSVDTDLYDEISDQIAKQIDKEILKEMMKYAKAST